MSAFRTQSVAVTSGIYAALRTYAELHDLDCVDTAAQQWLSERVEAEPLLVRFRKERDKRMKALREESRTWINEPPRDGAA